MDISGTTMISAECVPSRLLLITTKKHTGVLYWVNKHQHLNRKSKIQTLGLHVHFLKFVTVGLMELTAIHNHLQFQLGVLWLSQKTALLREDSVPKVPLNSNPKWGSMPRQSRRNAVQLYIPCQIDLEILCCIYVIEM